MDDESNEPIDQTVFKYKSDPKLPESTRRVLQNLRMTPFFIRLKLDQIRLMKVF